MYPFSVLWKVTPLYYFSSNNIYFAQKEPIKENIFKTFKCSGQYLWNSLRQFWNDKSVPLQILYSSSVSWKVTPLYFFLAETSFTSPIKGPLKWTFLRLASAQVKICQISYVNFETTSQFLSKFCILLQFHQRLFLCTFLSQKIYTLLKRIPLKWKFLRLLKYSGQNLSNYLS